MTPITRTNTRQPGNVGATPSSSESNGSRSSAPLDGNRSKVVRKGHSSRQDARNCEKSRSFSEFVSFQRQADRGLRWTHCWWKSMRPKNELWKVIRAIEERALILPGVESLETRSGWGRACKSTGQQADEAQQRAQRMGKLVVVRGKSKQRLSSSVAISSQFES